VSQGGYGGPSKEDIADQTWDEAKAGHVGGTTMGDVAVDADKIATKEAIADQIWDELTSGHTTAGTFAKMLGYIYDQIWTYMRTTTEQTPTSLAASATVTIQPSAGQIDEITVFGDCPTAGGIAVGFYDGSNYAISVNENNLIQGNGLYSNTTYCAIKNTDSGSARYYGWVRLRRR